MGSKAEYSEVESVSRTGGGGMMENMESRFADTLSDQAAVELQQMQRAEEAAERKDLSTVTGGGGDRRESKTFDSMAANIWREQNAERARPTIYMDKPGQSDEELGAPPTAMQVTHSERRMSDMIRMAPPDCKVSQDVMLKRVAALSVAFRIFDSDGGGTIERDELRNILMLTGAFTDEGTVDQIMKLMGADDGKVSEDAFVDSLLPYVYEQRDATDPNDMLAIVYTAIQAGEISRLKLAFDACDVDKSGEIEEKELAMVLKALGENPTPKQLKEMFAELDVNGDGGVSFDEFIKFMCRRKTKSGGKMAKFFSVDALNVVSSFMSDRPISDEESNKTIEAMPFLERVGADYLKSLHRKKELKRGGKKKNQSTDDEGAPVPVYSLSKKDRKAMKYTERSAVFWDMIIGGISAVASGMAELVAVTNWAVDGFTDQADEGEVIDASFDARITYYWLIMGGVTLVASILEIIALYYVQLRGAIRVSKIAGLKLFPIDSERAFVTAALARAALELPNPSKEEFGVNPLEEASKWRVVLAAIVYKAKTGLSTFLVRLLFKRVLARVAVKKALPFVAIPINMFWNGLIGYKCVRAARVVVLGPSGAVEMLTKLFRVRSPSTLPAETKELIVRSIAVTIVANEEMHPNLRILLHEAQSMLKLDLAKNYTHNSQLDRDTSKSTPTSPTNTNEDAAIANQQDSSSITITIDDGKAGGSGGGGGGGGGAEDQEAKVNGDDEKPNGHMNGGAGGDAEKKAQDEAPPKEPADGSAPASGAAVIIRPGNPNFFLEQLTRINHIREDQLFVLQVFAFSIALNGFVSGKVQRIWKKAVEIARLDANEWVLRWLTMRFVRGELMVEDLLEMFDRAKAGTRTSQGVGTKLRYIVDRIFVACSC